MKRFRLVITRNASRDVKVAMNWYQGEVPQLGRHFWNEIQRVYQEIVEGPLRFPEIKTGVRRALAHKFPYAIYYTLKGELIIIAGVVHTSRDPRVWQNRKF